jgi:hypothetical protein
MPKRHPWEQTNRHQECCIPGCTKHAWGLGRCGPHGVELKESNPTEYVRLRSLSRDDRETEYYRTKHPLPPKWGFVGDEAALAAMCEQAEAAQQEKRDAYQAQYGFMPRLPHDELDDLIRQEQEQANG